MVGLDAAGKTTILYKLKLGEIVTTIPTIGMLHRLMNFLDFALPYLYEYIECLSHSAGNMYFFGGKGTNCLLFG